MDLHQAIALAVAGVRLVAALDLHHRKEDIRQDAVFLTGGQRHILQLVAERNVTVLIHL